MSTRAAPERRPRHAVPLRSHRQVCRASALRGRDSRHVDSGGAGRQGRRWPPRASTRSRTATRTDFRTPCAPAFGLSRTPRGGGRGHREAPGAHAGDIEFRQRSRMVKELPGAACAVRALPGDLLCSRRVCLPCTHNAVLLSSNWFTPILKTAPAAGRRTTAVGPATTACRSLTANGSCETTQGSAVKRAVGRGVEETTVAVRHFPIYSHSRLGDDRAVAGASRLGGSGPGCGTPWERPNRTPSPRCSPRSLLAEPDLNPG